MDAWARRDYGFGLLGHVLARRAGQPYEDLVRDRICVPLGLRDTGVAVAPESLERFADGHNRRGRPVPHWDLPTLAGAGALRSTVDDLLRFVVLQLDPPQSRLSRAAARTQEPLVRRTRMHQCLGWTMLAGRREHERLDWHDGGTGGFRSFVGFSRPAGTGVVVLSNSARWVNGIGFAILTALSGEH